MFRTPIISDKSDSCPVNNPFGYVYCVRNKINGHVYIGKHEWHYPYIDKSYTGSGRKIMDAYNSTKYNKETDFEIYILEWITTNSDDLNKSEVFWIDIFDAFHNPKHYNLTSGGDGRTSEELLGENNPNYGKSMSEEQKQKIREYRTGKKASKETRMKMSESHKGKNNHMYGKHISEEQKQKIRDNLPDYSGKNNPNYGNHKLAGENHPMYGKHLKESSKLKISQANTGRKHSLKERKQVANPVVKLDKNWNFIKEYWGSKEAMEEIGTTWNGGIGESCKSKGVKLYKGYRWLHKSDYEELQFI